MSITILDVAKARGVKEDANGAISGAEFERVGLPFLGGCQHCGESLAAYNMYPTKTGFVACEVHAEGIGFSTIEEFEAFGAVAE
jgi:hypothetical protein